MRNAGDTLIPVTLELGGKDPFIVCEDVDVPHVAQVAFRATLQSSEQNCAGAERFYVHKEVYPTFVAAVVEIVKSITAYDMGAICIQDHSERHQRLINVALDKGAEIVAGGSVRDISEGAVDQYFPATVINLYNAKVRRVVMMGLDPIGCAPYYLCQYNSNNGECVNTINNMIMEFNFEMKFAIEKLNKELRDANVIFCDAYLGSMDIMKNFTNMAVIASSVSESYLWSHFKVFVLDQNMRQQQTTLDTTTLADIRLFSQWMLDIGDGRNGVLVTRMKAMQLTRDHFFLAGLWWKLTGRAAEEVIFGDTEVTTGATGDLQEITGLAKQKVKEMKQEGWPEKPIYMAVGDEKVKEAENQVDDLMWILLVFELIRTRKLKNPNFNLIRVVTASEVEVVKGSRYENAEFYDSRQTIMDVGTAPTLICGNQSSSQPINFNENIEELLSDIQEATPRTSNFYVASTRQSTLAIVQCLDLVMQSGDDDAT
ncbi:Aldehyde dehydrogenase, conserved site-containing protein [Artemisia annua]|uniref:ATP-dependent DNA helicase n=1 Tax=Artemisia annua TaxID=35608 RepID=A0A2U1NZR5_ARTAN|nr:Aldehyde dehydrogenase, conserved site-containing protein [Artemisia annua]